MDTKSDGTASVTPESFRTWNENHAQRFDLDRYYAHPSYPFRFIERLRILELIRLARIEADHRVLEVGCGGGHILEAIPRGRLFGTDISACQIQRSKRRIGSKAKLAMAAGETMPFPDESFDRIICTEVIEHVCEPIVLLREIRRLLKKDGYLVLSVPNEALINSTKRLLIKTGLSRLLGLHAGENGWQLAEKNNLEEWHLHSYDLPLIRQHLDGLFVCDAVQSIPAGFLPFRYIVRCMR